MTSSILEPRRSFARASPSTHLKASTMLLFPEPFGPTTAVTPPSNPTTVRWANVLKPCSAMERRCTGSRDYQMLCPRDTKDPMSSELESLRHLPSDAPVDEEGVRRGRGEPPPAATLASGPVSACPPSGATGPAVSPACAV